MIDIKINITNKIANAIGTPFIVCGNSDYTVTFTFDAEWGAYQEKTARFFFVVDGIEQYIDVLFSGNTCNAPVLPNIEKVLIGVYTGNLRTTTGAEVRCKRSILFGGKVHEPPTTEDIYNEILEIVGKKLGSEGGTVTGDYYKDGNTFIHEGNLDLLDGTDNLAITKTATGNAITVDSSKAPLQNLKLFGKTTQNGTPTPSAPVPLVSVGDSGSFEVGVYGKNLLYIYRDTRTNGGVLFTRNQDNSFSLSGTCTNNVVENIGYVYLVKGTEYKITGCPNDGASGTYLIRIIYPDASKMVEEKGDGLLFTPTETGFFTVGIRVQQGTVTDGLKFYPMIRYSSETDETYEPCTKQTLAMPYTLRSFNEYKDEIDFVRGVLIQRCYMATDFSFNFELENINVYRASKPYPMDYENAMCSHTNVNENTNDDNTHFYIGSSAIWAYLPKDADVSNLQVLCKLETPQEIPLTETELNAYRHLYTNKGNTTILSECEDTEITYYVNKPNAQAIGSLHEQINKDYFKLQQAIIETGGN